MKIRPYQLSQLHYGEFSLAGYSVAGEESLVIAPELDVCFDIGKCPREALAVNNVLLTHTHTDHAACLIYYLAQRDFQGMEPGRIILPERNADALEDLLHAWGRFEGQTPPYRLHGVKADQDVEIRRGLIARTFRVKHIAGAVGYVMIDVKYKLKPEYVGVDGPGLVDLKKRGIEIEQRIETPLVAYLGDTGVAEFSSIPSVRDARVLLIECTFWQDNEKKRARDGRHIHVRDLAGVLQGMNNEQVVITHVTRRVAVGAARHLLAKHLPEEILRKTTFLMSREHVQSDQERRES